ncbi:patatin-like phospholipase family protein [Geopsychrobacter electrodiphilus]|uniref:patatin-like phospholipase family protein n=1 Tax=Geopsychrobacter electrodiphilus TaxID=225196 RepID=UPI00035CE1DD|nr:patatin-like phospholipase family protein [Geopsychrobacter electrodiphilus]
MVLMGGGIIGGAWEIGCLTALDKMLRGRCATSQLDIYIGISAGSVIASLLANRVPPAQIYEMIINDEAGTFNFSRSDIYRVKKRELLLATGRIFKNFARSLSRYYRRQKHLGASDLLYILQEQFPSGFFSLDPMQRYLCRSFAKEGLIDNFYNLPAELYIPAFDIDLGERIVFGDEGYRSQHICQAITASCAIPVFFQPHRIGNSHYIDGSTGRVGHIDLAIERGADLVIAINPRVPFRNDRQTSCLPSLSSGKCASITELGVSFVWEQSQRIEGRERLALALEGYRRDHPKIDIILIEPRVDEPLLFLQSPMSFESRRMVMEYGYQTTLDHLTNEYDHYAKIFSRHGFNISNRHFGDPPPRQADGP